MVSPLDIYLRYDLEDFSALVAPEYGLRGRSAA